MIETYFPLKATRVHTKDKPWITQSFKDLINQRQAALYKDRAKYRTLRNPINREKTKLRRLFFKRKISQITTNDPKQWWKHIKEVVGLNKQNNVAALKGLSNQVADGNMERLAEQINEFFWSVSSDLPPLPLDNEFSR